MASNLLLTQRHADPVAALRAGVGLLYYDSDVATLFMLLDFEIRVITLAKK
ncbi:MAG: hypothetical protein J0I90_04250 [Nitrosospira sp.]|jgi:hypothetical protein|nr:hypothetical protein [Nitrosospira sp.]MBN9126784.1 hypothetical protein [Nitrosospira sp.]